MDFLPVGSPLKRVKYNVDESSEKMVGASRPTKVLRSDFGPSDRTVTSAAVCPLRCWIIRYRRSGWSV